MIFSRQGKLRKLKKQNRAEREKFDLSVEKVKKARL